MGSMNIRTATSAYEIWLGKRMELLPADLRLKHQRMAESVFSFLRATFYRWAQLWPVVCPDLAKAPDVLGVGDLHVENFGTWRDREGRLVWGVNDFDEACRLPYTNDLVRLAVSAHLATKEKHFSSDLNSVCAALLAGYSQAHQERGRPFILAERHAWLRGLATGELREPIHFWDKLSRWPEAAHEMPNSVKQVLQRALPEAGLAFRVIHRPAGLGSLGRQRFTMLAEWRGGLVAREAKRLTASAWRWHGNASDKGLLYARIIERAVRIPDPHVRVKGQWLIRRLAPDCSRIELASLPRVKEELKLLYAMGWETANIHLADSGAAAQAARDLKKRGSKWLREAVAQMSKATVADWEEWRRAV